MAVIIGKISPDKTDPDAKQVAYYMVNCQHEKKLDTVCLLTMYLLPFKVFFSREI